jgi:hypothetical protein
MRGHTYSLGSKCALLIYHLIFAKPLLFPRKYEEKRRRQNKNP